MLELRPVCEHCAEPLPPHSTEARICSFECTFCRRCAEIVLKNVCPNCGGGFTQRPVRPVHDWKGGNCLANFPPVSDPFHRPVDVEAHGLLVDRVGARTPSRR